MKTYSSAYITGNSIIDIICGLRRAFSDLFVQQRLQQYHHLLHSILLPVHAAFSIAPTLRICSKNAVKPAFRGVKGGISTTNGNMSYLITVLGSGFNLTHLLQIHKVGIIIHV